MGARVFTVNVIMPTGPALTLEIWTSPPGYQARVKVVQELIWQGKSRLSMDEADADTRRFVEMYKQFLLDVAETIR